MSTTVGMEAVVEIDENERYWVGKGFCKGGLLPTDRGAFGSTDGSLFWKTQEDASEDLLLLGRGWVFKEGGDFATTQKEDPENCWMYASDFRAESVNLAKPNRSVLHWVRFRRLNRIKLFRPDEFMSKDVYEKCDHCDSTARDSLSKQILEILAYCTLLHNKTHVTDAIALPLKKTVIDIAIGHESPQEGNTDAFYQLDLLRKKLENLLEKERSHTVMSRLFSGIDFSYFARAGRKEFKERCDSVAARCLPKSERDAIAGLIVRKLDPHYQLHCDKAGCGENCNFSILPCPNEGCSAVMSKIYLENHNPVCPYVVINCDCGDVFPQHEFPHHLSQVCKLRDVECLFTNIGCIKVIKACDMQKHLTDDVNSHLLLAVNRIMEHQEVVKDMRMNVAALEHENKFLKTSLQKHQEDYAKAVAEIRSKELKAGKALITLETTCKKEFKKSNDRRSHVK